MHPARVLTGAPVRAAACLMTWSLFVCAGGASHRGAQIFTESWPLRIRKSVWPVRWSFYASSSCCRGRPRTAQKNDCGNWHDTRRPTRIHVMKHRPSSVWNRLWPKWASDEPSQERPGHHQSRLASWGSPAAAAPPSFTSIAAPAVFRSCLLRCVEFEAPARRPSLTVPAECRQKRADRTSGRR